MDFQQQLNQPMNSLQLLEKERTPTLTYYNIRGLCQPIRNILYFIGVRFDDIKISRCEQKQSAKQSSGDNTFNSGFPTFEDECIKLSNCFAISIYICKKYQREDLLGIDIRKKGKIREIMYKYSLEMHRIVPQIMQIVKQNILEHKQITVPQKLKKIVIQSKFINFCLNSHKKTQQWIFNEMSIVDFYFYEICYYVCGFFKKEISAHQNQLLYSFVTFMNKFDQLKLQDEKSIHQMKLFLPFKNQNYRKAIINSWQGDQEQDLV